MQVGIIGLGHMGSGMAANLLKAGHDLTVFQSVRNGSVPRKTLRAVSRTV